MARIYRLMTGLLILLAVNCALAADRQYFIRFSSDGKWYGPYGSLAAACSAEAADNNAKNNGNGAYSYTAHVVGESCEIRRNDGAAFYPQTSDRCMSDVCIPPDTVASYCQNAGPIDVTQSYTSSSSTPPTSVCASTMYSDVSKGCSGTFEREFSAQDSDGKWHHYGTTTLSAGRGTCNLVEGGSGNDPNATTPGQAPPPGKAPECSNGFQGTVNGIDTCVPYSSSNNGIGETTRTENRTNPDGSTSTTTTSERTECNGATCTTTTTVTSGGGQGGGGGQTTTTTSTSSRNDYCNKNPREPVCTGSASGAGPSTGGGSGSGGGGGGGGNGKGFCEENPNSKLCKDGSFGGSCAASFTCDGDAIQCAIAKEQHIRNCKLFDDPSDESQLYELEKAKDPNRKVTDDLPGNREVDISTVLTSSDQFIGGGACPADKVFIIMGQSISIPYSQLCPYLSIMGNILVIVSSIFAAGILLRRI